jgi:hypothetical protein
VDNSTTQFVFRLFACVLAGAIVAILVFLIVLGLVQGDGEAKALADTFTPLLMASLGAMVTIFLGSHVVALKMGLTTPTITAPSQAAATPQAAEQPATAPDTRATQAMPLAEMTAATASAASGV